MKFDVTLEKSFEGEYRVVLNHNECEILSMPWVVGQQLALQQFGILLRRMSTDVLYAAKDNSRINTEFIREKLLKDPKWR